MQGISCATTEIPRSPSHSHVSVFARDFRSLPPLTHLRRGLFSRRLYPSVWSHNTGKPDIITLSQKPSC